MATPRTSPDDAPMLPERSRDDTDEGWNEPVVSDDDEERLRQERPPHHDGDPSP